MKLKKRGGNSVKITLILSLIFISCSSSSETIIVVDLRSDSLTLKHSDIRKKKLLNFIRVYNSSNKNNNNFDDFKLGFDSGIDSFLAISVFYNRYNNFLFKTIN